MCKSMPPFANEVGLQKQARRKKNFQGGTTEKRPKISKQDQKIALLSLFQREGRQRKRSKNSTSKSPSTISVPCMWPHAADAHEQQ